MCTWRLLLLDRCLPQNMQPNDSPGLACLHTVSCENCTLTEVVALCCVAPVEDVHLEVPLLTGADVAAVGAVPPTEGLHHHHVGQTVLDKRNGL